MDLETILRVLQDLREALQLEANQSILKRDHCQGLAALGGMDALDRYENRLKLALGVSFVSPSLPKGVPRPVRIKGRALRGIMR